jgi:hypothetical protein
MGRIENAERAFKCLDTCILAHYYHPVYHFLPVLEMPKSGEPAKIWNK